MMEREYGAELFHRRGRRVELSALGLEMLPLARRMIALEGEKSSLLDDSGKLPPRLAEEFPRAVGPYYVTPK